MLQTIKDKLSTLIMLMISMTSNSFGDVLLSRTMSGLGEVDIHSASEALALGQLVLSQGTFWLAILFFTVFFALWTILLRREDVSYIMPMTAVTYVISALLAGPMLGEHVSPQRWAGTLLIVCGVAIVAGTGHDNEKKADETGERVPVQN